MHIKGQAGACGNQSYPSVSPSVYNEGVLMLYDFLYSNVQIQLHIFVSYIP